MPTEVIMPQMGESITEGTIARWLKQPGEAVRKDEPLLEISTDKVDAEVPSPAEGVLAEIRVPQGETVAINSVLAVIAAPGEAIAVAAPAASAAELPEAATVPAFLNAEAVLTPEGKKILSSPLVRRMAREKAIDLRQVAGSGLGGRITKADVLAYLSRPRSAAPAPAAPQKQELRDSLEPMTRMRSIIAERMVASVREIPHVYSVYKIDMTRIVRLREREKPNFEQRHGVRLTYMPFIAAAAVEAIRQTPMMNATVEGQSIRHRKHVNLGIAVALEWGLIVPVVKNAEQMSFVELARTIADLAERARTKKLKPEEAQGSTFTLTNSGVWGGEFGTPIINQPDSAILGIGGLRKEPAVVPDAEGHDTIAIRSMQQFCLGFDHRLIDGADAGQFLSTFQRLLERWEQPLG